MPIGGLVGRPWEIILAIFQLSMDRVLFLRTTLEFISLISSTALELPLVPLLTRDLPQRPVKQQNSF